MDLNSEIIQSSSKVGALLVKEGFLNEENLRRAFDIQQKEAEEIKMPFSNILVKKGFLTEEQIKKLMLHPEIQKAVESVIRESGLINDREFRECLNKKGPFEHLGDVLVREGYVNESELENLLKRNLDGIKLGKFALKLSMLTEKELEDAFRFKRYRRALGEILCDLNLITLSELNLVFQKYNKRLRLGEILLQQDIIDKNILEKVLKEQNHKGETLGQILVRRSIITVDQLYFALSVQYNVPFHNLDGFVFYEKQKGALRDIIGRKYAEENFVLPLFLNGNNLTLAVSNPSKVEVVHELRAVNSHLRINCVLITDEKFEQLFAILYGEMLDTSKTFNINGGQTLLVHDKAIVSNPETDSPVIDKLYEQYEMVKIKLGIESQRSDGKLFKEFIEDNYRTICNKFHCNKVSFYIEPLNGKMEILAAPIVENNQVIKAQASAKELMQCQD
jgi:type IV pilus assembly protein PilB